MVVLVGFDERLARKRKRGKMAQIRRRNDARPQSKSSTRTLARAMHDRRPADELLLCVSRTAYTHILLPSSSAQLGSAEPHCAVEPMPLRPGYLTRGKPTGCWVGKRLKRFLQAMRCFENWSSGEKRATDGKEV